VKTQRTKKRQTKARQRRLKVAQKRIAERERRIRQRNRHTVANNQQPMMSAAESLHTGLARAEQEECGNGEVSRSLVTDLPARILIVFSCYLSLRRALIWRVPAIGYNGGLSSLRLIAQRRLKQVSNQAHNGFSAT
jgi:hypothetical protein